MRRCSDYIRSDATYVDFECEYRHRGLLSHSVLKCSQLAGSVVRRREEPVHRSQSKVVDLGPVPYESGDIRHVGKVEEDGAEDKYPDTGLCEGSMVTAAMR